MAKSTLSAMMAGGSLDVPVASVYPGAGGGTTGTRASAASSDSTDDGPTGSAVMQVPSGAGVSGPVSGPGAGRVARGPLGQPLSWWGVLVALLFALMYVAGRVGKEGEFSNIKLSAYNILVITLAAMIGFGLFKVAFAKFRVPGLSTYVHAV